MSGSACESGHVAALASLRDVGPARMGWLLSCGEPEEVWRSLCSGGLRDRPPRPCARASLEELVSGWCAEAAADPTRPVRMAERLARLEVRVGVGAQIAPVLAQEPQPAAAVFERGRPLDELLERPRVALIGTRRPTPHGLTFAEGLGRALAQAGVCVVSGLALGVDAAAHRGALGGDAPPLAVIGAGHDRPCPARNRALAAEVASVGTILSEVPPGVRSAPWRFPVRNRMIAALAQVVVVVESRSAGGSMLTVGEALARDRAVMAVPGPVGVATSEGCHDLLRDGAEICTSVGDVLGLLDLLGLHAPSAGDHTQRVSQEDARNRTVAAGLSEQAERVLGAVAAAAQPLDSLAGLAGVDLASLAAAVGELERAGLVRRGGGMVHRC